MFSLRVLSNHCGVGVFLSLLLLFTGFVFFSSAGRDDSHITYWAAYALANFGEIVNYNGERVEQSSSLAHVLLLAAFSKIVSWPMATLGALFSMFFAFATVVGTFLVVRKNQGALALGGVLLVGSLPYFSYWAFGGLETTLAAFFIIFLVYEYAKYLQNGVVGRPSIPTVVITVGYLAVRPESVFVLFCALFAYLAVIGARFFFRRCHTPDNNDVSNDVGKFLTLMVLMLMVFAFITGLRYFYFGSFFPQPVSAKSTGLSIWKIFTGMDYLINSTTKYYVFPFALLSFAGGVVAIIRALINTRFSAFELMTASFFFAYLAFVVTVGGDWMEGARFLVPIIPLGTVLLLFLISRYVVQEAQKTLVIVLTVVQLTGIISFAKWKSAGVPLWVVGRIETPLTSQQYSWFEKTNRSHLRDLRFLVHLEYIVEAVAAVKPQVTVMSGQMGMIPYYLAKNHFGNIHFLDRFSLTDGEFLNCAVTKNFPRSTFGLAISWGDLFKLHPRLANECGIGLPDIIYDLFDSEDKEAPAVELAVKNGYRVVYRQSGDLSSGSSFRGDSIPANQMILIRNELAQQTDFARLGMNR